MQKSSAEKQSFFSEVKQVYYQFLTWASLPLPFEALKSKRQKAKEKELRPAVCDEGNEKFSWGIRL